MENIPGFVGVLLKLLESSLVMMTDACHNHWSTSPDWYLPLNWVNSNVFEILKPVNTIINYFSSVGILHVCIKYKKKFENF